jgi:hypothetical protein
MPWRLDYHADCYAAATSAVVGSRLGFKHIAAQPQFQVPERHVSKTRPQLPGESKLSEQVEMLLRIAERVILANDGERLMIAGQTGYCIKLKATKVRERLREAPHGPQHKP